MSLTEVDKVINALNAEIARLKTVPMKYRRMKFNAQLQDENARLREVLQELLDCPYVIDEATVPKAGIEAAPDQVVGTLHVALMRIRKARAVMCHYAVSEAVAEPM